MAPTTPDDLAYAFNKLATKQAHYKLTDDYFFGRQRLAFATNSFRAAFGHLFHTFAYNRCASVVDAIADRLTISGWETDGKQDGEATPVETAAAAIWRRNKMQRRQGEVHAESLRSGNGYVIVWPDEETGLARITPNAGNLIEAVYDDEYGESIAFAVKTWRVERGINAGRWRATVYEPDAIRRSITLGKSKTMPAKANQLVPYTDDDNPVTENEYGRVPVFHFVNNAATGCDGRSELDDVIPLQDGLNKSLMDMLVAGEFLGFPQRYVAGIDIEFDPATGKAIPPFDIGVDRLIAVTNEVAKFGQFDAADVTQFLSAQDGWDAKIARVSHVPIHWLNQVGVAPSGEALKTAESPFVAKGEDRQGGFGGTWAEVMAFGLEIDGTAATDAAGIQPIWKPVGTRSEMDLLQAGAIKASLNVPDEQIWAEIGYTPYEIAKFKTLKATAIAQQQAQFTAGFNRGTVPTGDQEAQP